VRGDDNDVVFAMGLNDDATVLSRRGVNDACGRSVDDAWCVDDRMMAAADDDEVTAVRVMVCCS